jgi:hypothetical protein
VDPDIPVQTIRVAVTQGSPDPNLESTDLGTLTAMTDQTWETAFDRGKPPKVIQDGADICLWYSTEVFREALISKDKRLTSKTSGTVFVHGIFFAHDAEKDSLAVGSRKEEYWDRSKSKIVSDNKWFRPAND